MQTRKLKHVRNFTTLSCLPPDSAVLVSAEGKTIEAQHSIVGCYASHLCLIRARRDLRGALLYLDRRPTYEELPLIAAAGIKEIFYVSDLDIYEVVRGITLEGLNYEQEVTDLEHHSTAVPVAGSRIVSFADRR